jgi:hypothetical protein
MRCFNLRRCWGVTLDCKAPFMTQPMTGTNGYRKRLLLVPESGSGHSTNTQKMPCYEDAMLSVCAEVESTRNRLSLWEPLFCFQTPVCVFVPSSCETIQISSA